MKCRKCGVDIPQYGSHDPRNVQHAPDIVERENRKLWELRAGQWCGECREKFVRELRDLNDKYWDCIEAQDGKSHEIDYVIYLARSGRIRMHKKGSYFGSLRNPISGHYPRRPQRRSSRAS